MAGHASFEVTLPENLSAMSCLKKLASIQNGFENHCNVCTSSVDMKRLKHNKLHIDSKKYTQSVALKRPGQPNHEFAEKLPVSSQTKIGLLNKSETHPL